MTPHDGSIIMSISCMVFSMYNAFMIAEIPTTTQEPERPKIVLYWYGAGLVHAHDFGLGLKCNKKCLFTNNRSFLPEADAVIPQKNLLSMSVQGI